MVAQKYLCTQAYAHIKDKSESEYLELCSAHAICICSCNKSHPDMEHTGSREMQTFSLHQRASNLQVNRSLARLRRGVRSLQPAKTQLRHSKQTQLSVLGFAAE